MELLSEENGRVFMHDRTQSYLRPALHLTVFVSPPSDYFPQLWRLQQVPDDLVPVIIPSQRRPRRLDVPASATSSAPE